MSRDPDSECTPLLDLWYDIYSHFSVVPNNYSPPLSGRVWLSIELCDFDISWVGFFHPRSCYSPRRCFTRTHPLQIQVGYIIGMEGVGGQRAF